MRINEDGNLLGRLMAMAVIVIAVVSVARLCGPSVCPVKAAGSCDVSAAKTAVN
jgi:hypothetical protein